VTYISKLCEKYSPKADVMETSQQFIKINLRAETCPIRDKKYIHFNDSLKMNTVLEFC